MAPEDSLLRQNGSGRGYRVEAPRVSDAIGLALRDAYDGDLGLPEDMAAMLRQLHGGYPREAC